MTIKSLLDKIISMQKFEINGQSISFLPFVSQQLERFWMQCLAIANLLTALSYFQCNNYITAGVTLDEGVISATESHHPEISFLQLVTLVTHLGMSLIEKLMRFYAYSHWWKPKCWPNILKNLLKNTVSNFQRGLNCTCSSIAYIFQTFCHFIPRFLRFDILKTAQDLHFCSFIN